METRNIGVGGGTAIDVIISRMMTSPSDLCNLLHPRANYVKGGHSRDEAIVVGDVERMEWMRISVSWYNLLSLTAASLFRSSFLHLILTIANC